MKTLFAIILVTVALAASPSRAGPGYQPGGPHLGPCGYGRVLKTICETRPRHPGPPLKRCRQICVGA
jgi:hypothetical protein